MSERQTASNIEKQKTHELGGCKMAVIILIYLYLSLRLRQNRTAQNMAKQKNKCTLFLDSLSFCVKDPPPYLQQGGREMLSKTTKKKKIKKTPKK